MADPDEMSHFVSFLLGLHCLPKYLFRNFYKSKRLGVYIVFLMYTEVQEHWITCKVMVYMQIK